MYSSNNPTLSIPGAINCKIKPKETTSISIIYRKVEKDRITPPTTSYTTDTIDALPHELSSDGTYFKCATTSRAVGWDLPVDIQRLLLTKV